MRRLAMVLAVLLLVPAPASAESFVAREGADLARIRVARVIRQDGTWLVRFTYSRVRGEPTAIPWEWTVRVRGVRQPSAGVGPRKRFVYDILDRRDPTQDGWFAWRSPYGATLRLLRDTCTWTLRLRAGTDLTPAFLGCHENE
jgi:hypothetical protein